MFATAYGWRLDEIRGMSIKDFRIHAPLVIAIFRRLTQERLM